MKNKKKQLNESEIEQIEKDLIIIRQGIDDAKLLLKNMEILKENI